MFMIFIPTKCHVRVFGTRVTTLAYRQCVSRNWFLKIQLISKWEYLFQSDFEYQTNLFHAKFRYEYECLLGRSAVWASTD